MVVAAAGSSLSRALMARPNLVVTLSGWSSGKTPLTALTCTRHTIPVGAAELLHALLASTPRPVD